MTTLIEQYDEYVDQQILDVRKKCSYLMKSKRVHEALVCLNKELPRRQLFYAERRKQIQDYLSLRTESGLESAMELFDRILGSPYQPVLELNIPRNTYPQSVIRTKQKTRVFNSGGPAHPSILSRKMKNSKGVRTEFRRAARLTFKNSKNSKNKKSSHK
jgi:hypothetical protein